LGAAGLQLAVVGQSRGWLFTLPLVVLAGAAIVRDRLRVAAAAILPIAATLIPVRRLLDVFQTDPAKLDHVARRAGHSALLLCAATFMLGTLLAWADTLAPPRTLSRRRRNELGAALCALALAGGCAGVVAATHGDPFGF